MSCCSFAVRYPVGPGRLVLRRANRTDLSYFLSTYSLLFLLSFLDRINIGVAKLSGLSTELKLTSLQYSTASMIFFVSYGASAFLPFLSIFPLSEINFSASLGGPEWRAWV